MRNKIVLKAPPITKPLKIDKIKKVFLEPKHGWLDKDGDFWQCDYGQHDDIAFSQINQHKYEYVDNGMISATQIMEKHGWIKIQNTVAYHPDHVNIEDAWYVTKKQFDFLNAYYHYHGHRDMFAMNLRIK